MFARVREAKEGVIYIFRLHTKLRMQMGKWKERQFDNPRPNGDEERGETLLSVACRPAVCQNRANLTPVPASTVIPYPISSAWETVHDATVPMHPSGNTNITVTKQGQPLQGPAELFHFGNKWAGQGI